ncbi:ArsR family transcriptional regulator [Metabacillus niabensis]|uniref:ArsR family transcriptional regulator n=2 Tax=Bacillaceae TaxID=186817 RepID=A0ABT9YWE9_9BACI|nr:ArsR family transcriptional regulator [Metabacillus niabensis]
MNKELEQQDASLEKTFEMYEGKFKAIADKKRLQIMNLLTQKGEINVNDLAPMMNMAQSKLSYHLKILLDANLIIRETRGTWNYYRLNLDEVNHLLSAELCCLFRPTC